MAQLCKKLIIKKFSPSYFEFGSKFWKSIKGSIIKDFTTENLRDLSENFLSSLEETNFKTLIFRCLVSSIYNSPEMRSPLLSQQITDHNKLTKGKPRAEWNVLICLEMFYFPLCLAMRYWSPPPGWHSWCVVSGVVLLCPHHP